MNKRVTHTFVVPSCVTRTCAHMHNYRACYGVLRFIMESGAKGCEVIVSGKLRGQRAKSMKFVDGLLIHSGQPFTDYIDRAVTHVLLRQGEFVTLPDHGQISYFLTRFWPYALCIELHNFCEKL